MFIGQIGAGTDFSSTIMVFPCQYQPIDSPHLSSSSEILLTEGQTVQARGPSNKTGGLTEIRKHEERKIQTFTHQNKHNLGCGGGKGSHIVSNS
jgi:hypothetical protein